MNCPGFMALVTPVHFSNTDHKRTGLQEKLQASPFCLFLFISDYNAGNSIPSCNMQGNRFSLKQRIVGFAVARF